MAIVVKIGGTNGAGKTSLMRAIIDIVKASSKEEKVNYLPGSKKVSSYEYSGGPLGDWSILGSYETACGGMDTITDKEVRKALIKGHCYDPGRIVVIEGLIAGKTYGALGELSETEECFGKWLYVFFNTPFEVCVNRVLERREKKGGEYKPLDPERTMRPTYKSCKATEKRAREQGHPVYILDYEETPEDLAKELIEVAKGLRTKFYG